MNVIECFSCSGGMAEGLRRAGLPVTMAFDYDADACASYAANLGHPPIRLDVNDLLVMVRAGWRPKGALDLMVCDPPCFPPGTMIQTAKGRTPIENIATGDLVYTHYGRIRRVTKTFARPYTGRAIEIVPFYRPSPIRCTPEHPLFVRRRVWDEATSKRRHHKHGWAYAKPEWITARELRVGDAVLAPRPVASNLRAPDLRVAERVGGRRRGPSLRERPSRVDIARSQVAWLLGLYLAEGHRRGREPAIERPGLTRREVIFSIASREVDEVVRCLGAAGEHGIITPYGQGVCRVTLNSPDWWALCAEFGDGASGKIIPEWAFSMPLAWLVALLDGYVYGDGHSRPNTGGGTLTEVTTVSEELAWSVTRLVERCEGVVASLRRCRPGGPSTILGRSVDCLPAWRVRWSPAVGRSRRGEVDGWGAWVPVQAVSSVPLDGSVHNFAVEGDESYVADGIAAHNCTPWSRAGKRKGVEDERDCLQVTVELVRELRPECALIANVPGLDDAPNWPIVQATIGSLASAGYEIDFARLDAADYGVPQHRIRPFWFCRPWGSAPLVWPARTHGPPGERNGTLFDALIPWVTCRQALGHLSGDDLGSPIRLRWRGSNGAKVASTPDDPARVVGTSSLSDGNVLAPVEAAVRKRNHAPSKKPRASNADEPAQTVRAKASSDLFDPYELAPVEASVRKDNRRARDPARAEGPRVAPRRAGRPNQGDGCTLFDGPDHRPSSWDEPAATITRNTHSDVALIQVVPHHPPSHFDEPSRTVCASSGMTPDKILARNGKHPPAELDAPAPTVSAKDRDGQGAAVLDWPWDRPSTTVCADDTIGPPGHHDETYRVRNLPSAIKLSEKAAAILQGFPESWVFVGATKRSRWSQLGMAMPPPLAEAVGRSIRRWFDKPSS